jgi:hypothetical protein
VNAHIILIVISLIALARFWRAALAVLICAVTTAFVVGLITAAGYIRH